MKLTLLFLAVVSCTVASRSDEPEQVFSPNREYRYDYESQILTGIPTMDSQYSGLKISARAIIQVESDRYVNLKLASCELHSVKEESGVVPTTWLSSSLLESLPAEHASELIDSLVNPIKFRYERGMVKKVYAMPEDPYWSVNVKRGIISLLNLDLNAENPVAIDSSTSTSYMGVMSPEYTTRSEKNAYKVVEPSTMGDCETWYNLVELPSKSEMLVSKVVDTKMCSPRVMGEWGMLSANFINENKTERMLRPAVAVDYVLSGSRHEFLIKSAVATSEYKFAPISSSIITMDSYVLQKLEFIKAEPLDRSVRFASNPVPVKGGLHAYMPLQALLRQEGSNSLSMNQGEMERAKIDMIDQLLQRIIEKTVEYTEHEVPELMNTITTIVRTLSGEEVFQLIKTYCSEDIRGASPTVTERKRDLLLDMLPGLPHPEVLLVLTRLLKAGHITNRHASFLIGSAGLSATPSPMVLNELLDMCNDEVVKRAPAARRAIILAVGTLSHKLIAQHSKMEISRRTTSSLLKNVVKGLKTLLESEEGEERCIVVIKSMGNTGMSEFFSVLVRVAEDKSESQRVRTQAIYAFRRMAITERTMDEVVRRQLISLYLDTTEAEEIRVACFLTLMKTRPGYSTLQMIGHSLNSEPNTQLASFVYTYIQNLAKSTIPQMKMAAVLAHRVLLTVNPVTVAPTLNSRAFDFSMFWEMIEEGLGMDILRIQSVKRVIPEALVQKIYLVAFDQYLPLLDWGFEFKGLDEVVRKVLSDEKFLGDLLGGREDLKKALEPLTSIDLGQVEHDVRKILEETNMPIPDLEKLNIGAYMSMFGNEMVSENFRKNDLLEIVEELRESARSGFISKLLTGYNVDIVKAVPLIDWTVMMPTTMGLPICLNTTIITAFTINGQVKIDGITSLKSLWSSPDKLALTTKLRISSNTRVYWTLGIQQDIVQVGAAATREIITDTPINFRLDWDRSNEKIALKTNIPREMSSKITYKQDIGTVKTFIPLRAASYTPNMYDSHLPKFTPLRCGDIFTTIPLKAELTAPVLGLRAKLEGERNYPIMPVLEPVLMILSRQNVVMSLESTYNTPDALLLEVTYGDRKSEVREESSGSWFGLFNDEEEASRGQFEPVHPDYMVSDPRKKQIYVDVKTIGGSRAASIKSKLTLVHDPSYLVNQINVQLIGANVITSEWKTKIDTLVNIPNAMKSALASTKKDDGEVISSIDISFGTTSFSENTIIAKLMPAKLVSGQSLRSHDSILVRNTTLKLEVSYNKVSSSIRRNMKVAARVIKPYLMPYVKREKPTRKTLGDSTELVFQIFPQIGEWTAIIITPDTTLFSRHLPIPNVWPLEQYIVPSTMDLEKLPVLPQITSLKESPRSLADAFYGKCVVSSTNVTTIVDSVMPLAELSPECETVLAHDCSPQSLYTVVANKVTAEGSTKVKVIIPHYKVEILKRSRQEPSLVVVNGETYREPHRVPINITRPHNGRIVTVLEVYTTAEGRNLVIKAPQVGIEVETSETNVTVKVSPLLMSTACGLCAHQPKVPIHNKKTLREGVSRTNPIVAPTQLYTVKSERCMSGNSGSEYSSSSCDLVERNVKITRVLGGEHQTCFSIRPQPSCSGFCSPVNIASHNVAFHCLPSEDRTTRRLVEEVMERPLIEMENRMAHTYQQLMVPEYCVA